MPDRPTHEEARRDSVQEAIEKITGIRPADTDNADEGRQAGDQAANEARDADADAPKQGKTTCPEADTSTDNLMARTKRIGAEADKRADVVDDHAQAVRQ